MKEIIVTRNDLYKLVWSHPITELAKKYQMSDNGLRSICKKHNIPLPGIGFWMKKKYGKKLDIPLLPESEKSSDILLTCGDEEIDLCNRNLSQMAMLAIIRKEIASDKSLPLEIPKTLLNPDKLIISTLKHFRKDEKNSMYRNSDNDSVLDILVSDEQKQRALLLMDYLIKLVKARGFDVVVKNGTTRVIMFGVEKEISIREKYTYVSSDDLFSGRRLVSTGQLTFRAGSGYYKYWADALSIPLEKKVINILAWIELSSRQMRHCWDMNEKRRQEEEERQRIRKELEEKIKNEQKQFAILMDEAERWHKSHMLRSYLEYFINNNIQNHADWEIWLDWARKKADWFDPLVNREDMWLGKYDNKTTVEHK